MKKIYILFITILTLSFNVESQDRPILDIMLTNYEYPFKVDYFHLSSQQQDLKMAYMDIHPQDTST